MIATSTFPKPPEFQNEIFVDSQSWLVVAPNQVRCWGIVWGRTRFPVIIWMFRWEPQIWAFRWVEAPDFSRGSKAFQALRKKRSH